MRRDTRHETAATLEHSLVAAYQENVTMQEAVAVLQVNTQIRATAKVQMAREVARRVSVPPTPDALTAFGGLAAAAPRGTRLAFDLSQIHRGMGNRIKRGKTASAGCHRQQNKGTTPPSERKRPRLPEPQSGFDRGAGGRARKPPAWLKDFVDDDDSAR